MPPESAAFGPATALQLWTVRHAAQTDLRRTLLRVAELGYSAVELAGLHGHAAADVKALLDDSGLALCGAHIGLDRLIGDTQTVLAELRALGRPAAVIPSLPRARWATPADAGELIQTVNALGATLSREGVALVLHNETDEFAPWHGGALWHTLLRESHPRCVSFQLDLFTAVQMGQDPLALIDAARGRLHSLHVIDWRDHAYVPIGSGMANWPSILARAKASQCRWLIVEHDEPARPFEDAGASLAGLKLQLDALARQ